MEHLLKDVEMVKAYTSWSRIEVDYTKNKRVSGHERASKRNTRTPEFKEVCSLCILNESSYPQRNPGRTRAS